MLFYICVTLHISMVHIAIVVAFVVAFVTFCIVAVAVTMENVTSLAQAAQASG